MTEHAMVLRCVLRVDDASEKCDLCGATSLSIKMAVLCAAHHSAQRCAHVDQGVQVGVPWIHDFGMSEASDESPVIEYAAPAPVVSHENQLQWSIA